MTISGHQRPSVTTRGHPWSSEAISRHQRPSEAIRGHQRPSEVIRGHPRPSEAISGHQWPSVAISGHLRSSVVIRGHQWPSEAISGHQRSSVVIRGHQRPSAYAHAARSVQTSAAIDPQLHARIVERASVRDLPIRPPAVQGASRTFGDASNSSRTFGDASSDAHRRLKTATTQTPRTTRVPTSRVGWARCREPRQAP